MTTTGGATPEQERNDAITGTSDDQRFKGAGEAAKAILREMDSDLGPATDDDLLQLEMYLAAHASGKFSEWPFLRRAVRRSLAELRTLRQQNGAVEALWKEERAHLKTIDERDVVSDAFDRLVAMLEVETEYSNVRGFEEILEDCQQAIDCGVGKDWLAKRPHVQATLAQPAHPATEGAEDV